VIGRADEKKMILFSGGGAHCCIHDKLQQQKPYGSGKALAAPSFLCIFCDNAPPLAYVAGK